MRPPVDRQIPQRGAGAWLASRSDGARLHAGVDLGSPAGTVVRAPESGVIVLRKDSIPTPAEITAGARRVPWGGYGPAVLAIQGASGAIHLLAHLETGSILVQSGESIEEGKIVGKVSRLSHVHWEVRTKLMPPAGAAQVEVSIDPQTWLDGRPISYMSLDPAPCPPAPGNTTKTPRACRPLARRPRKRA